MSESVAVGIGVIKKISAIVILGAIVVIFALLWVYGFSINTIFDYNLQSNPLFSQLPTDAQNVFNTNVSYQLTTYGWGYIAIAVFAIIGTVGAIFGSHTTPDEDF